MRRLLGIGVGLLALSFVPATFGEEAPSSRRHYLRDRWEDVRDRREDRRDRREGKADRRENVRAGQRVQVDEHEQRSKSEPGERRDVPGEAQRLLCEVIATEKRGQRLSKESNEYVPLTKVGVCYPNEGG